MREIVPGVHLLTLFARVNVYFLESEDGLVLIDSGVRWHARAILNAARRLGGSVDALRHVVITHAHIDHVGAAAAVKARTGADLWLHPADREALTTGHAVLPDKPGLLTWLFGLFMRVYAMGFTPAGVEGDLADAQALPFAHDWRAVHTPGHSPGQCSLYNERQGALLTGDALMRLIGWRVRAPHDFLTPDVPAAHASVRRLAELDFDVAGFGHGPPLLSGADARVRALAAGL